MYFFFLLFTLPALRFLPSLSDYNFEVDNYQNPPNHYEVKCVQVLADKKGINIREPER